MKIRILIALLFITSLSFGQSKWGVKGGLNYNLSTMGLENAYNAIGDIVENHTPNNGWHVGLISRNFVTQTFFVQLEGMYSETSNEITVTNNTGTSYKNNFENKIGQFNILGGLEFFEFIRGQGGLTGKLSINDDYADTFGAFKVGYNVGVGINLGRFNFDIGYNSSFANHEGEWNSIPLSFDDSELVFSMTFLFKK